MSDEKMIGQFRGNDVWRDPDGTVWVRQQQLVEAWEQGYDAGIRFPYPRPDWVDDAAPLPRPDGSSDA